MSKCDITNLENKIKVLEGQIGSLRDTAAQRFFGTVHKENQIRRIKFLDDDTQQSQSQ